MKLVVVTTSKMNRDYIQWQYFYDYQLSVHKTGSSRSEVDLSRPVRSLLYLVANKNISQCYKMVVCIYTIYRNILWIFFYFFETRVLIFISYTLVYSYIHVQSSMYYFIDQKRFACFKFCITYEDTENCQRI